VIFEDLLNQTLKTSPVQGKSLLGKVTALQPKIVENNATQIRPDGNNVDVDEQSLELARTQIQYEYMVRAISEDIVRMKYAINGGRG
jgi:flagellar basal-body rod protein FlgB